MKKKNIYYLLEDTRISFDTKLIYSCLCCVRKSVLNDGLC